MTTTPPSDVRTGLTVVTDAAVAEARAVAAAGSSAEEVRAALFLAAPLIVQDYADGASALALDWYEELREAARPSKLFDPVPLRLVTDEDVRASVARTTITLRATPDGDLADAVEVALTLLDSELRKMVASGFWDTMTDNSLNDPSAQGWRRYARAGACKFCLMLADKGAVYTKRTANFAAHGDCHCLAGPEFDSGAPLANAMQYLASRRKRTAAQKAALREYLNDNFPDAHG